MFGKKNRCSSDTAKSVANQLSAVTPSLINEFHAKQIEDLTQRLDAVCKHLGIYLRYQEGYKSESLGGPLGAPQSAGGQLSPMPPKRK